VARNLGIKRALENRSPGILQIVVMARSPLRVGPHCTQHPT
jgi:hypothetical protein